jgi:hypothetical protein
MQRTDNFKEDLIYMNLRELYALLSAPYLVFLLSVTRSPLPGSGLAAYRGAVLNGNLSV